MRNLRVPTGRWLWSGRWRVVRQTGSSQRSAFEQKYTPLTCVRTGCISKKGWDRVKTANKQKEEDLMPQLKAIQPPALYRDSIRYFAGKVPRLLRLRTGKQETLLHQEGNDTQLPGPFEADIRRSLRRINTTDPDQHWRWVQRDG